MMLKRKHVGRLAATLAAAISLGAVAAPASAVGVKDLGIDLGGLGVDLGDLGGLGDIFGKGGRTDSLGLAERILESELPRRVGPASRYDVKLSRTGNDLTRGRLSQVDVTGINVRTNDGLVIPKMDLKLSDVRLGLGSRRLESVGKSLFSLGLGSDAVNNYVRKRAGADVRDVRVAFRDGQIVVNATPELLGFALPSEVRGKPAMNGTDSIDFRASRVSVAGLNLPRFGVDMLEDKVNPVVDLSRLNLPVRIQGIRVSGDRLVADGVGFFDGRR